MPEVLQPGREKDEDEDADKVREGIKKSRLFREQVPYQGGGSNPLLLNQAKCKKHVLEKLFFSTHFSV